MEPIRFKKLHPEGQLPARGSSEAAGLDLYTIEDISLKPLQIAKLNTGIAVELPVGTCGIITGRSGRTAAGLLTLQGLIDADFRGQLKVMVHNISRTDLSVPKGARVAQLLVLPSPQYSPVLVEHFSVEHTTRATNSFGSTGN